MPTDRESSSPVRSPNVGLAAVRAVADVDLWPDELPPPREVLLERVRGSTACSRC